jgi:transmembrane sensor
MSRHQTLLQEDPVAMRAGSWLIELESPDVPVERIAEWQQWMAADDSHRRAYEALQFTWQNMDRIKVPAWPNDIDVQADTYVPSRSVSEWQSRTASTSPARRFAPLAAAAAIAVIGIGAWLAMPLLSSGAITVETDIGENRELRLPDGSRVYVGAGSLLTASLDDKRRDIVLERGEAYFEVAKDPLRPFRVEAGGTDVTAIGTAFNVRHTGSQVVVAVSEGEVAVDNERLKAGQQIVTASARKSSPVEPVAPAAVASWREGRLQFSGEPLSSVVIDINRYSTRQIEITDPAIANLQVTGTVSARNIESWLKSLEKSLPVRVSTTTDGAMQLTGLQ